jgi:hypothetical protein
MSEFKNKFLQEIAEMCWNPAHREFDAEQFAELIVRECARIADETQFKLRNYPVSIAIENHFLGANNGT